MPPASTPAPAFDPARWHTTTGTKPPERHYRYDHCRGCLRLFYLPSTARYAEHRQYDADLLDHQAECTLREGRQP